jgi:hypothetical protein
MGGYARCSKQRIGRARRHGREQQTR